MALWDGFKYAQHLYYSGYQDSFQPQRANASRVLARSIFAGRFSLFNYVGTSNQKNAHTQTNASFNSQNDSHQDPQLDPNLTQE